MKCEITIHSRTETVVPGIVNEDNNFCYSLIEYPCTENSFKGVLVVSSFVDLSRNVIPMRIINVDDKARFIK